MTTNRLVLIFLGFIFLIIIILGSNRIATSLRKRFASFLPNSSAPAEKITPTPITFGTLKATPTPTIISTNAKNVAGTTTYKSTPSGEIPATGPNEFVWLILGGSGILGFSFKKLTSISSKK